MATRYTTTCDRCGAIQPGLPTQPKRWDVYEPGGRRLDLCDDCMDKLATFLVHMPTQPQLFHGGSAAHD